LGPIIYKRGRSFTPFNVYKGPQRKRGRFLKMGAGNPIFEERSAP